MPLALFGFLGMSLIDILDILLVALIIFVVFRWIRNSTALNIFLAILVIYVLIVIFQPEIRHFLFRIGSEMKLSSRGRELLNRIMGGRAAKLDSAAVDEVAEACRAMSNNQTGALMVFPHGDNLQYIIGTGDKIDATISRRLIMNLFFKNSPLHDGAMIIAGDRIVAARCTLPITDRTDIPASFGMRHRAAIGISEQSDADVIVVSEETGDVSFVRQGELTHINNMNELKLLLDAAFTGQEQKVKKSYSKPLIPDSR